MLFMHELACFATAPLHKVVWLGARISRETMTTFSQLAGSFVEQVSESELSLN